MRGRARAAILTVWFALLFSAGALHHAREENRDPESTDQSAYLLFAERLVEEGAVVADGARGIGYPLIAATVYSSEGKLEGFFRRAKYLTIVLTTAGWLGALWLFRRWMPVVFAFPAWLAVGFCCLVYYAPYTKAEPLYYLANLGVFALFGRLLAAPGSRLAALAGAAFAGAWLLKSSASLAFVAYAPVALLVALVGARARSLSRRALEVARRLRAPLTVAGVFLILVSPVLFHNKAQFGRYFYNVNTTFYVWYDSWGEARRGTRAHGDREGWPDMPDAELPSAAKYLEEHDAGDIVERFHDGLRGSARSAVPHGILRHATVYACGLLALALAARERTRALAAEHWPVITFAVTYLLLHVLSTAWYFPINLGARIMAAGFPVFVLTAAAGAARFGDAASVGVGRAKLDLATGLAFAVALMLAYDVPYALFEGLPGAVKAGQ